jgi:hypothetical protein
LLTVSEVTVHHGGEGIVEYLPWWWPGSREREFLYSQTSSFFPFYSIQISSLLDGATHTQGVSSALFNLLRDGRKDVLYWLMS